MPTAGKTIMAGLFPTTFEVTSDMVDGRHCIVRQTIWPGRLFWPHVHVNEDQVIIVVKGQLGVRVGEREWTAAAGEIVYRPKGVPTPYGTRPPKRSKCWRLRRRADSTDTSPRKAK
jgi:mannose-6-phosphate isomerase-like protein (cupin superfamily)